MRPWPEREAGEREGVEFFATGEVFPVYFNAQRLALDVDLGRVERQQIPVVLDVPLIVDHQIAHGSRRRVDHDAVEASDDPMALVSDLNTVEPVKRPLDLGSVEIAQPFRLSLFLCLGVLHETANSNAGATRRLSGFVRKMTSRFEPTSVRAY